MTDDEPPRKLELELLLVLPPRKLPLPTVGPFLTPLFKLPWPRPPKLVDPMFDPAHDPYR